MISRLNKLLRFTPISEHCNIYFSCKNVNVKSKKEKKNKIKLNLNAKCQICVRGETKHLAILQIHIACHQEEGHKVSVFAIKKKTLKKKK